MKLFDWSTCFFIVCEHFKVISRKKIPKKLKLIPQSENTLESSSTKKTQQVYLPTSYLNNRNNNNDNSVKNKSAISSYSNSINRSESIQIRRRNINNLNNSNSSKHNLSVNDRNTRISGSEINIEEKNNVKTKKGDKTKKNSKCIKVGER